MLFEICYQIPFSLIKFIKQNPSLSFNPDFTHTLNNNLAYTMLNQFNDDHLVYTKLIRLLYEQFQIIQFIKTIYCSFKISPILSDL
ncbi:hypothetical protein D3C84_978860 [compost metagenome]